MSQKRTADEFTKSALEKKSWGQLNDLEKKIKEARKIKMHIDVFTSLDTKPDLSLAQAWLKAQKTTELNDTDKPIVAETIQWLKEITQCKMFIVTKGQKKECKNLGTKFRNDTEKVHFRFRTKGKQLCELVQLPESLTLEK